MVKQARINKPDIEKNPGKAENTPITQTKKIKHFVKELKNINKKPNKFSSLFYCWTCGLYKADYEICKSCPHRHSSVVKINS